MKNRFIINKKDLRCLFKRDSTKKLPNLAKELISFLILILRNQTGQSRPYTSIGVDKGTGAWQQYLLSDGK